MPPPVNMSELLYFEIIVCRTCDHGRLVGVIVCRTCENGRRVGVIVELRTNMIKTTYVLHSHIIEIHLIRTTSLDFGPKILIF